MDEVLIGTSGYDYPEWKGVFYPQELKRKDFLSYYSTVFNALELNFCFYSMPTESQLLSFYERSEGRVKFSVKANRLLTHEIGTDWKNSAQTYKKAIIPLLEKNSLSGVLFQFPQSFHYIPENRIYLANIIKEFDGFPVIIEFRHKEWIRESVFAGLVERGASVAFCDMPQLKYLPDGKSDDRLYTQFIGKNAYIRLHGRNANAWYCKDDGANGSSRYDYNYAERELVEFIPVIKKAFKEGRNVQVFFNNHPKGNGANNALYLKRKLDENSSL